MTIERLPCVDNSFGDHDLVGGQYQTEWGYWSNYYNKSVRGGQSVNPVQHLHGGTPWRPPSNYNRFIRKYTKVKSSRTGFIYYWYVPGNSPSGMDLISRYDSYWNASSAILDSNIQNEAETKALLKIAGNKAQFGQALAESREAFELISQSAVKVLSAYRAIRRGNVVLAARQLLGNGHDHNSLRKVLSTKNVADKWLELQYGWKPLLSDIHDAYGVLTGHLESSAFLLHGKGGSHRSNSYDDQLYDSAARITYSRSYKAEQICICHLTAELSSSRWRQCSQVGLINPLSIGWEVVPFSFLIDWFMPIGNVLEALTARAGLNFVGGCNTFITGGQADITPVWANGGFLETGYLQTKVFGHNRNVLGDWPTPVVYARESPFSTKHSLNALALWRGNVKGLRV